MAKLQIAAALAAVTLLFSQSTQARPVPGSIARAMSHNTESLFTKPMLDLDEQPDLPMKSIAEPPKISAGLDSHRFRSTRVTTSSLGSGYEDSGVGANPFMANYKPAEPPKFDLPPMHQPQAVSAEYIPSAEPPTIAEAPVLDVVTPMAVEYGGSEYGASGDAVDQAMVLALKSEKELEVEQQVEDLLGLGHDNPDALEGLQEVCGDEDDDEDEVVVTKKCGTCTACHCKRWKCGTKFTSRGPFPDDYVDTGAPPSDSEIDYIAQAVGLKTVPNTEHGPVDTATMQAIIYHNQVVARHVQDVMDVAPEGTVHADVSPLKKPKILDEHESALDAIKAALSSPTEAPTEPPTITALWTDEVDKINRHFRNIEADEAAPGSIVSLNGRTAPGYDYVVPLFTDQEAEKEYQAQESSEAQAAAVRAFAEALPEPNLGPSWKWNTLLASPPSVPTELNGQPGDHFLTPHGSAPIASDPTTILEALVGTSEGEAVAANAAEIIAKGAATAADEQAAAKAAQDASVVIQEFESVPSDISLEQTEEIERKLEAEYKTVSDELMAAINQQEQAITTEANAADGIANEVKLAEQKVLEARSKLEQLKKKFTILYASKKQIDALMIKAKTDLQKEEEAAYDKLLHKTLPADATQALAADAAAAASILAAAQVAQAAAAADAVAAAPVPHPTVAATMSPEAQQNLAQAHAQVVEQAHAAAEHATNVLAEHDAMHKVAVDLAHQGVAMAVAQAAVMGSPEAAASPLAQESDVHNLSLDDAVKAAELSLKADQIRAREASPALVDAGSSVRLTDQANADLKHRFRLGRKQRDGR